MREQKQKSPDLAERGFSENIHNGIVNTPYLSMVLRYPDGRIFLDRLLLEFENLLQDFDIRNPKSFCGSELDLLTTLLRMKDIRKSGGSTWRV